MGWLSSLFNARPRCKQLPSQELAGGEPCTVVDQCGWTSEEGNAKCFKRPSKCESRIRGREFLKEVAAGIQPRRRGEWRGRRGEAGQKVLECHLGESQWALWKAHEQEKGMLRLTLPRGQLSIRGSSGPHLSSCG